MSGGPSSGAFEVRSLTLGELLDESFVLFRRAWVRLIAFQLVAFVPTAIAEILVITALGDLFADLIRVRGQDFVAGPILMAAAGAVAVIAVQILVAPLVGVALTRAVADTYLSRAWTVLGLLRVAAQYALRAIGVGIVLLVLLLLVAAVPTVLTSWVALSLWSGAGLDSAGRVLLVVVGALLAGLPVVAVGVYITLRYMLSFATLVVEDASVITAFRRSAELMKGRYWAGFGLWGILMLVSILLGFAASMFVPSPSFETFDPDQVRQILPQLVDAQIVTTLLSEAMGMFTRTYGTIAWTLFYFSARCEREGFDLMVLARRFGAPGESAA